MVELNSESTLRGLFSFLAMVLSLVAIVMLMAVLACCEALKHDEQEIEQVVHEIVDVMPD